MIDVVYLAYFNPEKSFTIDAVKTFLATYTLHKAGIEHNLVIAAKNWIDPDQYNQLKELAEENNAKLFDLPDDGFDFGTYIRVSRLLDGKYAFYTGARTKILSDDWLLKLYTSFKHNKDVKLAGPMGSWESGVTNKFPNPHIRTCSFMIERELFLEYASTMPFPQTKLDTYEMEHGENNLTNFVVNKGFKAVVVNSDGNIFSLEEAINSQTYITPDATKSMFFDKWSERYHSFAEPMKAGTELTVWGKVFTKLPTDGNNNLSSDINIFIIYDKVNLFLYSNVFRPIFNSDIYDRQDTEFMNAGTEINIADKRKNYGSLCTYYWIWKNYLPKTNVKYLGFTNKLEFLDFNISNVSFKPARPMLAVEFLHVFKSYSAENIMSRINDYDIILAEKTQLNTSVYEQYINNHPQEDIDLALETIKDLYPEYEPSAKEVMQSSCVYTFKSFIMKKELMNEYFEWLFNILTKVEGKSTWKDYIQKNEIETPVFLAERLLNIWIEHKFKNKGTKILNTTSLLLYDDLKEYIIETIKESQPTLNSAELNFLANKVIQDFQNKPLKV